MGSHETHELRWGDHNVQWIKSSGITDPITVKLSKLTTQENSNICAEVWYEKTYPKPALFISECAMTEISVQNKMRYINVTMHICVNLEHIII